MVKGGGGKNWRGGGEKIQCCGGEWVSNVLKIHDRRKRKKLISIFRIYLLLYEKIKCRNIIFSSKSMTLVIYYNGEDRQQ
jgi:hypothetical protein